MTSPFTLTKTRFASGVWEGCLVTRDRAAPAPEILISHEGRAIRGATVSELDTAGRWALSVPVPPEVIGDGVQTVLITDAGTGDVLASFSILAGDGIEDSLAAEVGLLRDELDLLKRAFRRHCLETGA